MCHCGLAAKAEEAKWRSYNLRMPACQPSMPAVLKELNFYNRSHLVRMHSSPHVSSYTSTCRNRTKRAGDKQPSTPSPPRPSVLFDRQVPASRTAQGPSKECKCFGTSKSRQLGTGLYVSTESERVEDQNCPTRFHTQPSTSGSCRDFYTLTCSSLGRI